MRLVQLLLEASIPLMGYFLWDWSLYFIILFYLIDVLSSLFVDHLKSKKIVAYKGLQSGKKTWLKFGLLSSVLFLLNITVIHLALFFIDPEIDFLQGFIAFLSYEEMGIQQGYVIIPLVFFANFQRYKMEFLMPAKYRVKELSAIWRENNVAAVLILAFSTLVIGLSQFLSFNETVLLILVVVITSLYNGLKSLKNG